MPSTLCHRHRFERPTRLPVVLILFTISVCLPIRAEPFSAVPHIHFERVPDRGIQPQLLTDNSGFTHLIYFKRNKIDGRSRQGNIFYRQRQNSGEWSKAVRVSHSEFNHLGPVSKSSAYVDNQGRVHVVWFIPATGYMYSRSDVRRAQFEQSRAVITEFTEGLDAEASISGTDSLVTITWHAGALTDEASRAVYSVTSNNYGESFGGAIRVSNPDLGACACCALATQYDTESSLQVAYRSAINNDGRHMQFIKNEPGTDVAITRMVGEWNVNTCPVSSNHLNGNWLVFETEGEIFQLDTSSSAPATRLRRAEVRQKHPTIAMNRKGHRLIAWGEANGYFAGGYLAFQLFNPDGTISATTGPKTDTEIDNYSVVAVGALQNDTFLVLY